MKNIFAIIALLVVSTGAFAQVNNITKSKISFQIKNLGIKTGGTIGGIQGTIAFDPAKPASSKIEATADVNTINTDNSMRDEHLKKEEYFYAATYPKITMSSVAFQTKSGNNYTGQFNITIKGKTKLVDVPFTYTDLNNGGLFKGSFKINRKDFGVGGGSMTMGNEVTITFEAEATK
jgi:polyisoprenoid-binding protein YceI